MNAKLASLVTVALIGLAGCASGPGVVRGQNPPGPARWHSSSPPVVEAGEYDSPHACPTCGDGHAYGRYHEAAHPPVYVHQPFGHVLNHGHHRGGIERRHHPTHYHWFHYKEPKNLVYPPPYMPGAVVQYPYYTVKGPSDFFLQ